MITYSIIQKSKLEGALRLNAEYYQPEYLEVAKKIVDFGKYHYFGDLIEIFNSGKNWSQIERGNIKFLRTQHIRDILIRDEEDLTFCDGMPAQHFLLKEGDLLFTRVGGVSDSSIASKKYEGHFYSDNILRIRIKKLNSFFVSVFLNSYYGKSQLERAMKGVAQPLISRENFEKLKIPQPKIEFQEEIEKLVLKAYDYRNQSLFLYSQAENLLLEKLGLKDFKLKDDLSYIVNLSEIKFFHRADAEYFQPKYSKIIHSFSGDKKPLKIIARRKTKKIKIIKEKDYGYIEISDVNVGSREISFNTVKGHELPANAKMRIDGGELIISKVRPTRGAVVIIPDSWNKNFIASGAFSIFEIESPLREYLQVLLRSIIGKLQLEKSTTGTSYPIIKDRDVENLLIPILPKPIQQKIADLVQKSHKTLSKTKILLEESKQKVEKLIER